MGKYFKGDKARLDGLAKLDSFPQAPVSRVGVDVGAEGLHVCVPSDQNDAATWPVWYLAYETIKNWPDYFIRLCKPGTIVTAEPTGWHYLSPLAMIIEQFTEAHMYMVDHSQTGHIRNSDISNQKTDITDARALAEIANRIYMGKKVRGVWTYDHSLEQYVIVLRQLVNSYTKAVAENTRCKNRLKQLGHSMNPVLTMTDSWYRCIEVGAITPKEILELERPAQIHGNSWNGIKRLQALLLPIRVLGTVRQNIQLTYQRILDLNPQVEAIKEQIREMIHAYPFAQVTQRLETLPLMTDVWIATLHVACHGMMDKFNERQFKGALGAYPQLKQSGKMNKAKSSKKGYRPAMNALFQWTMKMVSGDAPDNEIRRYFAGGEKNGGKKFSATQAKAARLWLAVAKKDTGYQSAPPPSRRSMPPSG